MKTIVMLGTPHLEYKEPKGDRIEGLERRVDWLKRKLGAPVVMEEWSEKRKESVASVFAKESGLRWVNVGTPDEPQYRTCNPYINHPENEGILPEYGADAPEMHVYGPFDKQENRERRMVENVRAEMEKYETGLFILGAAHLHSVFGKLQRLGFRVRAFCWLGV